jgi:hypothetical protein
MNDWLTLAVAVVILSVLAVAAIGGAAEGLAATGW